MGQMRGACVTSDGTSQSRSVSVTVETLIEPTAASQTFLPLTAEINCSTRGIGI